MVVGRLLSYWEGDFSGAMLNFGRVPVWRLAFMYTNAWYESQATWSELIHSKPFSSARPCYIILYKPRKSKDQTLPLCSRESFTWITLKTILCLVLDFQGKHILGSKNYHYYLKNHCFNRVSAVTILYRVDVKARFSMFMWETIFSPKKIVTLKYS